ncbi:uncharacterized protein LOC112450133 [Kryptolebias marmoratus]|uniref:uncharacterized protein LOC112450133 n=1 Tax=Kryptolebias marmoratus TaxID=37003 RepID=UPI000D5309D7|nr:uncharacterized protein LOC112450133 [Kryptolebias marmoratus]
MSDPTAHFIKMVLELKAALMEMRYLALVAALLESLDPPEITESSDERRKLLKLATENCSNQTVLTWLREKSESSTFIGLVKMFDFLKERISEEEKKNHDDTVDITFVAHGSMADFMIPASCLLPLSSIRDVVLYSPWNCASGGSEITYGIATGRIKPQHRVFYCTKKGSCELPDEKHRPSKLPDHWNSMKKAGDQKVPNITVSPLQPEDGVWKSYESLTKKYGPPGRNRIIIPFTVPSEEVQSISFSVVTLALSLVLLQSRFKATVHLDACLTHKSDGQTLDRKYLEQQYAYAANNTGLKCSQYSFSNSILDSIRNMFF